MLFFLACGGQLDVASEEPLAYVVDRPAPQHYSLTSAELNEIQGQLQQILDVQLELSAAPILASQHRVFEHSDERCPSTFYNDGNAFWVGYCTAESGLYLNGYLSYNAYEQTELFGDGNLWDLEQLNGSMDATLPDGSQVHWGGAVSLGWSETVDGQLVFTTNVQGSFLDEQATVQWLREGISTELSVYGSHYPIGEARGVLLAISGSIDASAVLPQASNASSELLAIRYKNLRVLDSLFEPYHCTDEPAGDIELRRSDGQWLRLSFDVEQQENGLFEAVGGACDGCGELFLIGATSEHSLGPVCLDDSVLTNFAALPWDSE